MAAEERVTPPSAAEDPTGAAEQKLKTGDGPDDNRRGVHLETGFHSLFPTPLLLRRFGNEGRDAEIHADILKAVERREAESPSLGMSNVMGWHSDADVLDWPDPGIDDLRKRVLYGLDQMVVRTSQREIEQRMKVRAWANLARTGAYNAIHNHTPALFSGVYYVSTGDPPRDNPRSGLIEFVDPRPGSHGGAMPTHTFTKPILIDPEPGMLIVFPGWLLHTVHPYDGETPRLSIAFNLHVK